MRDYSNHATNRAESRDVEITDIRTCVVEGNFEWNLIEVETDAGVTGIGEAYRGGVPDVVEYTKRFLIGENPLDVERIFRRIVQEMSGHGGTTGKVVTAASGIEIALWDAAGKILDLPVYQLLGGKFRDEVRIYCDCHAGEAYAVDDGYTAYADTEAHSPAAYANEARRVVDTGFTALKFDLDMSMDNEIDPSTDDSRTTPSRTNAMSSRPSVRRSGTGSIWRSTVTGTTPSKARSVWPRRSPSST